MAELSLEILSKEFENDTSLTEETIAKHGFKFNRISNKWYKYKFMMEDLFETALEDQKTLKDKLAREYITGTKKSNIGMVTKNNVKDVIQFDNEYITLSTKIKNIERMSEYITDFVIPYLRQEVYTVQYINKHLKG